VSVSIILSDLEGREANVKHFRMISVTKYETFNLERPISAW